MKMIKTLRNIANWFISEADKLEKLDAKIDAVINKQSGYIFGFGVVIGLIAGVSIKGGF
jgi:hypothetical protein